MNVGITHMLMIINVTYSIIKHIAKERIIYFMPNYNGENKAITQFISK